MVTGPICVSAVVGARSGHDLVVAVAGEHGTLAAHAVGIELDDITTTWDKWVTDEPIKSAKGVIEPGQVAAINFTINGIYRGERRIQLGGGASLDLLPRQAQHAYADVLRGHDLGLALMLTPHPSLVPLEMASAGMATVTNSFENKTPAELEAISPNLIVAEPSLDALADALSAAVERVEDLDARAQGSHVRWSRSWAESFDDELMERVEGLLER